MHDRVLFPLMGLAAILMIALALVWPQGLGARSPAPFGHPLVRQTPGVKPGRVEGGAPPALLGLTPTAPASSARPDQ